MKSTRASFIRELQGGGDPTWEQLDRIYRPLIVSWLRRMQMIESDIDDVAQEIMIVVLRRIEDFEHNGRVGAFRAWLRTIAANTTRSYLRKNRRETTGIDAMQLIEQLADDASDISRQFDRDHDHYLLRGLMARVMNDFQPNTVAAFEMHVLKQVDAKATAEALGISPRAVYIAKSRVLRRLREEAADWIDDLVDS